MQVGRDRLKRNLKAMREGQSENNQTGTVYFRTNAAGANGLINLKGGVLARWALSQRMNRQAAPLEGGASRSDAQPRAANGEKAGSGTFGERRKNTLQGLSERRILKEQCRKQTLRRGQLIPARVGKAL